MDNDRSHQEREDVVMGAMTMAGDIVTRRVDNPLSTWAEFLHQLDKATPYAGKVEVLVNSRTILGGFNRFHGTEAQQMACARFKSLYERSQLGGARAVDPSLEPVDGGWTNPEAVFESGASARKELIAVQDLLGPVDYARIEFVVIRERGPTPYAKWRGFGIDGRACARAKVEVREIVDRLAVHWKYQGRDA
jgi:hypothetical protein